MTAVSTKTSGYRPEIQGIRTIGALLVACFHIWGGRVSGGVDVFFVISGFLITGSLYREVRRSQTIDVFAFWGRIAKRIAPMAYTVLALTLAAALLWMPLSRQQGFLAEVIYSALHLENLKLMMNAVDYLARDEAPSPVQQFWALSVQVQFYAIWPFLLLGMAFAARWLRAGAGAYLAALVVIFLGSLAYSVMQTRLDPSPAYFNTLARVWEFALGSILAVYLPQVQLPERLREIAGWAGLLLVVSCGFVVPASAHYPGYVALWPTLGAALVLLSGGGRTRFGADRILAWKPLVAMGEISFSFYLWHWPVLIFALLISGKTQLGLQVGLAVIAIALCAAFVSARWLEQPIHRSSIGKRRAWHVHAMAATMAVPVLGGAFAWVTILARAEDGQISIVADADYPDGAIPASLETALNVGTLLRPTPAAAKRDISRVYRDKCHQAIDRSEVIECVYGNTDMPTKTIALVGGSHSAQWLAALEVLSQQYGWKIVSITKSACPFDTSDRGKPACSEWNRNVIDHLGKLKPDVVFTTSTRRRNLKSEREFIPEGYRRQWERLAEMQLSVIAIRDNPWLGFNVPECIEKNASDILRCSRQRAQVMNKLDPALSLQPNLPNVAFVDLTDRFCDHEWCYPVSGNVLIYSDKHHITATFSRNLAPVLGERMKLVRPDLFLSQSSDREAKRKSAEAE